MSSHQPDQEPDDLPPLPEDVETELYEILLDRGADERPRLLAGLCDRRPDSRAAIRARVDMMQTGDRMLERVRDPLAETPLPERVGDYRVESLLGEGGFGTVYRALQHEPVRRVVALKVLHPLRLDERSKWRFQAERQVLARMQHPFIAQIFDAGSTDEGLHYFAMEFVDGEPITAWCDRFRLSLDDRVALFLKVCAAVQHAHQRGVVHRDLTPNNVMVKLEDGEPTPKVIDFGVAKVLEDADGKSLVTRDGAMIGTPGYMSPEQAAGEPVDTRADVYALGALLYELLSGDLPFARTRLCEVGLGELARLVQQEEPRRLSTALRDAEAAGEAIAARRASSAAALQRALTGDLEWIVRKSLARSPEQRYGAVGDLIADVERYRRREPVSAREPEVLYLLRRFVDRHRVAVALTLTVLLGVGVGVAGLWWSLRQVSLANDVAEQRRELATRNEYAAHMAAAQAAIETGDVASAQRHLDAAAPPLRGWEWRYLASLCDTSIARLPSVVDQEIGGLLWLDDDQLCQVYYDANVARWDPSDPSEHTRLLKFAGHVTQFVHSRDRRRAFAVTDNYSRVTMIDTVIGLRRTLHDVAPRGARGRLLDIRSLALSPDERVLAISQNVGDVTLLDIFGRQPPRRLCNVPGEQFAWRMEFVADGEELLLALADGRLQRRRVRDGALVAEVALDKEGAKTLAVDEPRDAVFVGGGPKLHRVDLSTMRLRQRVHVGFELNALRLSDDRRVLFGAGAPGTSVLAWSAETLELHGRFHGLDGPCEALELSPDGKLLACTSERSTSVWSTTPRRRAVALPAGFNVTDLGVAADGSTFAVCNSRGNVKCWNAATLELEFERDLVDGDKAAWLMGCAVTGGEVFVAGHALMAIDRTTGEVRHGDRPGRPIAHLEVSHDGRWLLGTTWGAGGARIWSLPDMKLRHRLDQGVGERVRWDRASGCFVCGVGADELRWIEPETGRVGRREAAADVTAFALRGGELVRSERERIAWQPAGAAASTTLLDRAPYSALAIEPGEGRIAASDDRAIVHLISRDGVELLSLSDAPKAVARLAFVHGGERLIGLSSLSGAECFVMVWGVGL
ncbi:MAG: WD40 repeat domain-containing serine/threonine protein kinase [Planctomycetota bacterium]